MAIWAMIAWTLIVCVAVSLLYLGAKVPDLFSIKTAAALANFHYLAPGLIITTGVAALLTFCFHAINAMVCLIYAAMIWFASDLVFGLTNKLGFTAFKPQQIGYLALALTLVALLVGWHLAHHVYVTKYHLQTSKTVPSLRIVMFGDAHIGSTFDGDGFAKHLRVIESYQPDLVLIAGDYVDDSTTKEEMVRATRHLGRLKTKYGIYFVFGNHDRGYYGSARRGFSAQDLVQELTKQGVHVLLDQSVLIDNSFYVIGRHDYSIVQERRGARKPMQELIKDLDQNRYMIVLDHQPADFVNQAKAEVDLVLCGHTHGGQLFPFNRVGKWLKVNDLVYGHEKRHKTDFIVTSGISDWAIKFKTGTRSEFVVIDINKK